MRRFFLLPLLIFFFLLPRAIIFAQQSTLAPLPTVGPITPPTQACVPNNGSCNTDPFSPFASHCCGAPNYTCRPFSPGDSQGICSPAPSTAPITPVVPATLLTTPEPTDTPLGGQLWPIPGFNCGVVDTNTLDAVGPGTPTPIPAQNSACCFPYWSDYFHYDTGDDNTASQSTTPDNSVLGKIKRTAKSVVSGDICAGWGRYLTGGPLNPFNPLNNYCLARRAGATAGPLLDILKGKKDLKDGVYGAIGKALEGLPALINTVVDSLPWGPLIPQLHLPLPTVGDLARAVSDNTEACTEGNPSNTPGDPQCRCIAQGGALYKMAVYCSNIADAGERKGCNDCFNNGADSGIWTSLGCVKSSVAGFIKDFVFKIGIGLAGLIALLCIIYSAFILQTSGANPEKIKKAQEMLTSCIIGLLLIIFSVFILRVIGVDIIRIPGLGG